MPILTKEAIIDELRDGCSLIGPPDALSYGRGFQLCRNGVATEGHASAKDVRDLADVGLIRRGAEMESGELAFEVSN
jgi:hypothetical protein